MYEYGELVVPYSGEACSPGHGKSLDFYKNIDQ